MPETVFHYHQNSRLSFQMLPLPKSYGFCHFADFRTAVVIHLTLPVRFLSDVPALFVGFCKVGFIWEFFFDFVTFFLKYRYIKRNIC
jgi:hypothetical protein